MKIKELIQLKQKNLWQGKPITIVCIGDSVTQGCFEPRFTSKTTVEPVFDYKSAYATRLKEILNILYPSVQFNVINSGISGDNTEWAKGRFDRDVMSYNPDLVIISFGLNDSHKGLEKLQNYEDNLAEMFEKVKGKGIDCIFLTQNMMTTKTEPQMVEEFLMDFQREVAANIQNSGILTKYFESAKKVCEKYSVKVCDMYDIWQKLYLLGVDITELLANKSNHPIREFHYYIAIKLIETIFSLN